MTYPSIDRLSFEEFYFKAGADKLVLSLTPFWKDQDFIDLHNVWSPKIGADAEDLLLVMTLESRLWTYAQNKSTLAVGLIQLSRIGFQLLGVLPSASPPGSAKAIEADKKAMNMMPALSDEVRMLGVKDQMERYIIEYFAFWKKTFKGSWTAHRLYLSIIAPVALTIAAEESEAVLYQKPSAEYALNQQLDINGDGKITVSDLKNAVNWHLKTPEFVAAKYRYRKLNDLYPFNNPVLQPTVF